MTTQPPCSSSIPPKTPAGIFGGRDLRREVLSHCVYAGMHPYCNGWLMIFEFGCTQATVVSADDTHGIEIGLMRGEWGWLIGEWLTGDEVFLKLVDVMDGKV